MPIANTPTLLTIEDDESVRRSLRAYLEDSGFIVLEAADGQEGLDMFRDKQPELVLTDLRMPKIDGLGLIKAIHAESPDTPVIVVSGTGRIEDAIQAVRLGAWDYIIKPIHDLSVLELTIDRALERARLLRENHDYQEHLARANELLQQEIIERKLAEAAEKEQRIVAEALRDTAAALNSTLDFEKVLDQILVNVERVVQHHIATIMLIEGDKARMVRWRGHESFNTDESMQSITLSVPDTPGLRWMVETGQPFMISDTQKTADWIPTANMNWIRSYVGAPIRYGSDVIGFIGLESPEPNFFKPIHAEGLRIFVDQAALAIQNARLYAQAEELAAMEERNRLAHDLHDSVSQTLWSATIIAETLPAIWEKNRTLGEQHLRSLYDLTRGALAEMRSLLLELRPGALEKVELGDLLRQLTQAFSGRTNIPVALTVQRCNQLPANVQVMLYRISQEALNNVTRHSKASQVEVDLRCQPDMALLRISDNGRGFVIGAVPPGHFGLGIMRERAESIGANVNIESAIGHGTTIEIVWETQPEDETE